MSLLLIVSKGYEMVSDVDTTTYANKYLYKNGASFGFPEKRKLLPASYVPK
jgi:hypothetical protein